MPSEESMGIRLLASPIVASIIESPYSGTGTDSSADESKGISNSKNIPGKYSLLYFILIKKNPVPR